MERGGQIVDATVIEERKPRLTKDEKATLRSGGTPSGWSKARTRQIDRDGRWTFKRGRKPPPSDAVQRQAAEIAVPVFGYKNHVGIDCTHGFVRRFTVTHAARHDGSQLGVVLDPTNTASGVWADTAYRSRANLALLNKRGLVAQFQRAKPRGKPMPAHVARGNARRARVRSRVEHVFAAWRECPSSTSASASIRRVAFASRLRAASARRSTADNSRRVTSGPNLLA